MDALGSEHVCDKEGRVLHLILISQFLSSHMTSNVMILLHAVTNTQQGSVG